MSDSSRPRIDRAALERIMQRAAELQAGEADVGEGLTPDEVMALGREVGIPGRYLQQAMLEQATAIIAPAESGLAGRTVGPAEVSAHRVVVGDPEDAARALIAWFDKNEILVVLRQQPGRVSFEPLGGMPAALRRGTAALSSSKPRFMLTRATEVVATFAPLEAGYCHVTLTADLRRARAGFMSGAATGALAGVAGAFVAGVLSPFAVVFAAPVLAGGALAWYILRQYRPLAARSRLGLERALDYLERGGIKPGHQLPPRPAGLLEALAGELRKAISGKTGLWLLLALLGCRATTSRPAFNPLPVAVAVQVELGIPEATRALSEALARDSIPFRTIRESDGYLDSGWLDVRSLEHTSARPLGLGVARVRAWVNPDKPFWSELVVEATYRAMADPSRPERELDTPLPEDHPLQRKIAGVLRSLVERFGDAETLRGVTPPAKPDTVRKKPDTTSAARRNPVSTLELAGMLGGIAP